MCSVAWVPPVGTCLFSVTQGLKLPVCDDAIISNYKSCDNLTLIG